MGVWANSGIAVSQVYDTKMTTPAFGNISWTINNPGAYSLAVRTSANPDMTGAGAWTSFTSSGDTLGAVTGDRYLQFQATLTAVNPYTTYPQLDNVKITWPGQTALVEIGGVFTKRPNYGVFKVLVDGNPTVKALNVALTATKKFRGKDFSFQLSSDVKPKNTGK